VGGKGKKRNGCDYQKREEKKRRRRGREEGLIFPSSISLQEERKKRGRKTPIQNFQ